jgi:RsiW-degrading membrane proteinase PrsW (M82 family)
MNALKIFVLIMPIPAIYLIYARFIATRPDIRKHAESFLAGVLLALLLYMLSPFIHSLIPASGPLISGFVKAGLIEKTGALILLLLVFRYYPNTSVVETTLAAVLFGAGFASVENAAYTADYGNALMIIRSLFSLPVHMITCGILGYYLGRRALSGAALKRAAFLGKGFAGALIFHGLYDTLLLSGAPLSYIAAPLLVTGVAILEILLARAQSFPSDRVLASMHIRHEDWIIVDEQSRYERWILQSMGRGASGTAKLFVWEPGLFRMLIVIFFMGCALWGLSFRDEISVIFHLNISPRDGLMIFGIFPISVSAILIIVGAVNPEFFAQTEMKIPVIIEAEPAADSGHDETFVTYSLSRTTCFLKTHEPLGTGRTIRFAFSYGRSNSGVVATKVLWENHDNKRFPFGSVLGIIDHRNGYSAFIARYFLYKTWKGFIFNLRLPGFEASRRLFTHPLTAMQEDRFYKAGDIVFREGDEAKHFYLLKKGKVSLHKSKGDGSITLGFIEQGELFGEMAVIPGRKRGSTAACDEESIIAIAGRDNLSSLIRYNPDFAVSMIQMLAERTNASEAILLEYIALLELKGGMAEKKDFFRKKY